MMFHTDRYPPGEYVMVVAAIPGDTRRGHVGQVERTYADGGEMMHVVQFDGGPTAHYHVEELLSMRRVGIKTRVSQQES